MEKAAPFFLYKVISRHLSFPSFLEKINFNSLWVMLFNNTISSHPWLCDLVIPPHLYSTGLFSWLMSSFPSQHLPSTTQSKASLSVFGFFNFNNFTWMATFWTHAGYLPSEISTPNSFLSDHSFLSFGFSNSHLSLIGLFNAIFLLPCYPLPPAFMHFQSNFLYLSVNSNCTVSTTRWMSRFSGSTAGLTVHLHFFLLLTTHNSNWQKYQILSLFSWSSHSSMCLIGDRQETNLNLLKILFS